MHKIVMKDPIVLEYFLNQNGNCIDSRVSQHALAKDGCLQVVKSVQLYMELEGIREGDVPNSIEEDFPIFIQVDIRNFFPSHNRQLFLDLLAGHASCDYPDLKLLKGAAMPTISNLTILLPFFAALYGASTVMTYYHRRHTGRHVTFSEGSSQGCPTGGFAAILGLQACLHGVAQAFHPDEKFRMWAKYDDITIGGNKRLAFDVLEKLRKVLKLTLHVDLNLQKCAICALQLKGTQDPTQYFADVYEKYPDLCNIPIRVDGTVLFWDPNWNQRVCARTFQQNITTHHVPSS
jgi:hypothetical protein